MAIQLLTPSETDIQSLKKALENDTTFWLEDH